MQVSKCLNMKKTKKAKKTNKLKRIIIGIVAFIVLSAVVVMPAVAAIVYESIFSNRFEPSQWSAFDVGDFSGLIQEQCTFESKQGKSLAGFKYSTSSTSAEDNQPRGVVIIAHGLGGGGQSLYMNVADFFTRNSYLVFAYDATGNGQSQGDDVRGLPQGVMDLCSAIEYVKSQPEYSSLPIMLFGHSWGAYSSGAVLEYHPDVRAVVMLAGFNASENMLRQESRKVAGGFADITMPYVKIYERLKFGDFSVSSAIKGFKKSDAGVMIVHSADDTDVLMENGYDLFYETYGDLERFSFVKYENRGHSFLYCSDQSAIIRQNLAVEYSEYLEKNNKKHSSQVENEFMRLNVDKTKYFELDLDLMQKVLSFYDNYS